MRKHIFPITILGFVAFLGVFFIQESSRSHYVGEPNGDIFALTQQTQYPITTERIVVSMMNCGDYGGEINKPQLEVERNGKWYIVNKTQEGETAELLYMEPGGTTEFEIFLTAYEGKLIPGRYRAVFAFHGSDEYYAYEFNLVEG